MALELPHTEQANVPCQPARLPSPFVSSLDHTPPTSMADSKCICNVLPPQCLAGALIGAGTVAAVALARQWLWLDDRGPNAWLVDCSGIAGPVWLAMNRN